MGRKTWDQVISFGEEVWPYGDRMVWIWSRQDPSDVHMPEIRSKQAKVVSASPADMLMLAKEEGYCHAYIDGGSTIQAFIQQNCVQEFVLTRVPLLLGSGVPLFSSDTVHALELNHVTTRSFSNGLVQSHYLVQSES